MSRWIKATHEFGDRCKILTISHRTSASRKIIEAMLSLVDDQPDALENLLLDLILTVRPELAGCVILYMDFDLSLRMWRIFVSHGSFDRKSNVEKVMEEPLFIEDILLGDLHATCKRIESQGCEP